MEGLIFGILRYVFILIRFTSQKCYNQHNVRGKKERLYSPISRFLNSISVIYIKSITQQKINMI